jgi:hypothetical protein
MLRGGCRVRAAARHSLGGAMGIAANRRIYASPTRQYQRPRANPPNAISPIRATMMPRIRLQKIAITIPTMTRIPPTLIPVFIRSSPFPLGVRRANTPWGGRTKLHAVAAGRGGKPAGRAPARDDFPTILDGHPVHWCPLRAGEFDNELAEHGAAAAGQTIREYVLRGSGIRKPPNRPAE